MASRLLLLRCCRRWVAIDEERERYLFRIEASIVFFARGNPTHAQMALFDRKLLAGIKAVLDRCVFDPMAYVSHSFTPYDAQCAFIAIGRLERMQADVSAFGLAADHLPEAMPNEMVALIAEYAVPALVPGTPSHRDRVRVTEYVIGPALASAHAHASSFSLDTDSFLSDIGLLGGEGLAGMSARSRSLYIDASAGRILEVALGMRR